MQEIKYSGKIIEVIEEKHGNKIFEIARRSPGVRALIIKSNKILLSREYRTEINDYDYRLPGGKVFDTLQEYRKHINEDLTEYAMLAVKNEVSQEVGLGNKKSETYKNFKGWSYCRLGLILFWNKRIY